MRSSIVKSCWTVAIAAAFLVMAFSSLGEGAKPIPGRYVVMLEDEAVGAPPGVGAPALVRARADELARIFGLEVLKTWGHTINAFSARVPAGRAEALARHPFVAAIEQSMEATVTASAPLCYPASGSFPVDTRTPPQWPDYSQAITCANPGLSSCIDNWGLDRIDEPSLPRDGSYGWGIPWYRVYIYVIDTGVNDHRELRDYTSGNPPRLLSGLGYNATDDGGGTGDYRGHGTHVAAIAAGRTYGVAKGAYVVPVRFTKPDPATPGVDLTVIPEWLIDSFEHVGAQVTERGWPAVVNLSGANWHPYYNSVTVTMAEIAAQNLIESGVQIVQSAGNDGFSGPSACTYSLGQDTDALVVGATTHTDARWIGSTNASNQGPCVDLYAPGADIISAAWKTWAGYCQLSGTSMAAPHVTGAMARYLASDPNYTPSQLRGAILSWATDWVVTGLDTSSNNRLLYVTPY
jgi:subtilisin family serine protease